jgi:hypothetical protein
VIVDVLYGKTLSAWKSAENHEKYQGTRSLDRDFNPRLPEYEVCVITTGGQGSVTAISMRKKHNII